MTRGQRSRGGVASRVLHWLDRTVLGLVMGAAAFALERAVVRSARRVSAADSRR